jgi:hypothetical protein
MLRRTVSTTGFECSTARSETDGGKLVEVVCNRAVAEILRLHRTSPMVTPARAFQDVCPVWRSQTILSRLGERRWRRWDVCWPSRSVRI